MDIKLNLEQKQAVEHDKGPLLIVAGAGTGKTAVITERISYLLKAKKLKPENILALTFTEKAAEEMEVRVDKALPYGYVDLWISTFHSFCQKILQLHGLDIGLPNDFKVMTQTDAWLLVREHLEEFELDYYKPLGNPTRFIHALIQHFGRAKDEVVYPQDYLDYAEKLQLDLDNAGFGGKKKGKTKAKTGEDKEVIEGEMMRAREVADAYHKYQQLLLDNNSLDFGDLINYTLQLFQKRPNILKKYQEQFKYILVDEFQDTNYAQYELIKLLAGKDNNITVVGDDDQCLPSTAKIMTLNGQKIIKNIKLNDEILTAVGRGYLGVSKVTKKFVNKKRVKYLTFKTSNGESVRVTDNHKMFCRVPAVGKGDYWYVYLMFRQGLGWRMGITNDLATRLRLERSADSILAIKAFNNEVDARFWETVWSLQYGIPTVCFKTSRKGLVMNESLLEKLYDILEVDKGIKRLARDMNIDLDSHHVSLGGVIRGQKARIKIHLDMCYRNYRSKGRIRVLQQAKIAHLLSVDTSDKLTVQKLKRAGFELSKTKKGWRLRISSKDISQLGTDLKKIEKITNGISECRFQVAKTNKQHLHSLLMPAKNIRLGMFLPVVKGKEIIYDSVVNIHVQDKIDTVYDLEIADTHNFIADNIVVHNSIYKFRGASISNILEFKKDYPKSKEVYLNKNYRSGQKILDTSYNFIQLNNPNRLEVKLATGGGKKLSKKLNSQIKDKGEIEAFVANSLTEEVAWTVNKIGSIFKIEPDTNWSDFAILVRANDSAKPFQAALQAANIPNYFLASYGLYNKAVVRDIVAWLKLLDDYHESPALWRILNLPFFALPDKDLIKLSHWATRKRWSLYEALTEVGATIRFSETTDKRLRQIVDLINKYTALAREKNVWDVIYNWLTDSGYMKYLDKLSEYDRQEQFNYLNSFYKKVKSYENKVDEPTVKNFVEEFNYELDSGEQGAISFDASTGPDTVKIMTVHSAKGLEFKYVFLVNMVEQRFPTINRSDVIALPDDLIKEIIPEGDVYIEEERRLFYVGMTRAKQGLFLTAGEDYGGVRKKKPSRFLEEIDYTKFVKKNSSAKNVKDKLKSGKVIKVKEAKEIDYREFLPNYFSFSQLKAFETCPWQYYYQYILQVPVRGNHVFSYGKSMHGTLQKFFGLVQQRAGFNQTDLFGKVDTKSKKEELVSQKELLDLYEQNWINDWYDSKKHEQERKAFGKKALTDYYKSIIKKIPVPIALEKSFYLKVGEYTVRGFIDRIDELPDGSIEIIDYKTGKTKDKLTAEDKEQLFIYQIAGEEVLGKKVSKLTFQYLDTNKSVSFIGKPEDLKKTKVKIVDLIKALEKTDWAACPGFYCQFCNFKDICDFKQ